VVIELLLLCGITACLGIAVRCAVWIWIDSMEEEE
jgi:hypothetical protein